LLHAQRRPAAHAPDDRRARVGPRLRRREQHHRRLPGLPAPQDRRRGRDEALAHGTGQRLRAQGRGLAMTGWPPTVRTRLTLWYTGVLVAILLVVSALSYSLLRWSVLHDVDQSLVT